MNPLNTDRNSIIVDTETFQIVFGEEKLARLLTAKDLDGFRQMLRDVDPNHVTIYGKRAMN